MLPIQASFLSITIDMDNENLVGTDAICLIKPGKKGSEKNDAATSPQVGHTGA